MWSVRVPVRACVRRCICVHVRACVCVSMCAIFIELFRVNETFSSHIYPFCPGTIPGDNRRARQSITTEISNKYETLDENSNHVVAFSNSTQRRSLC